MEENKICIECKHHALVVCYNCGEDFMACAHPEECKDIKKGVAYLVKNTGRNK